MGCCFSNDDDKDSNGQDPNERTRLLPDMASQDESAGARPMVRNGPSNEPCRGETNDEQSVLNRILHQTVNDIIDVAALDGQTMEHCEYMDRAHQYNVRLSIASARNSSLSNLNKLVCTGVAAPQIVLGAQAVSLADIQLIKTASAQVHKAAQEMKVPHKEDLVVPFGVP